MMRNIELFWGALYNLWLLPIIGLIIVLLFYRYQWTRRAANLLAASKFVSLLLPHFSVRRNLFKTILFSIAVLFLMLALLKPQWNKKEQTIMQEGRDLLIGLDISRSMLARDCQPDRLTCAKNKIKRLIRNLECERVGLLLFSGSAFMQCPLTADKSALFMFLEQVDVETISSGTTALDQVLKKASEIFEAMPERKNKILVLFTDGEDFSSNLAQLKSRAQRVGLHIFTVGIGTLEGAPIPLFDDKGYKIDHQKDKKGSVVISRLNEGILHSLASDSGGTYVKLTTADDVDMKTIIQLVQAYEKEKLEDKKFATLEEQYPYFLLVSFICLLIEWII